MERIFNPRSLVIIGVSESPENLARNIVVNLVDFGWLGELWLLGRQRGECCGRPILTDYDELPENLDLAVILTPAATVPEVMRCCIGRGIRRMVIESGGFSEFSPAGKRLEDEIRRLAARHGVRFVGPNGISIINRYNGLCLPFMPLQPDEVLPGRLSVISQSGGMALSYIACGRREDVGVAKVISMGNKTNLDEIDYLDYLAADSETGIIGLYLESLERGREFIEHAARCSKPIIMHKANTAPTSQVIAQSHTAAMAVDDEIVEAACRRAGICRVDSFADFINAAKAFSLPPLAGGRLLVISRSGGHALVTADAVAAAGFTLVPLGSEFESRVAERFRATVIRLTNPLDLGDIFDIDYYAEILEMSLAREDVDGVIFNHVFQSEAEFEETRRLVRRIAALLARYAKPVGLVLFARLEAVRRVCEGVKLPVFAEPLEAVRALARLRRRTAFRKAAAEPALSLPEVERPDADMLSLFRAWLTEAAGRDGFLHLDQALRLLAAYGLPIAPGQLVRDRLELRESANEIGFPLVLKVVAAGLSHKSDRGGVLTGIATPAALDDVSALLFDRFAAEPGFCGVLVQKEVEIAFEVIAGARRDPSFGPVFLLGLGGIYAEILRDFQLEIGPLDRALVDEMVGRLRGGAILRGARGRAGLSHRQLYEVMAALQALMQDLPEIVELEINPLAVTASGDALAVDSRIRVGGIIK